MPARFERARSYPWDRALTPITQVSQLRALLEQLPSPLASIQISRQRVL